MPGFAPEPQPRTPMHPSRALCCQEDAWLLRQIGGRRPVLWLRPQPLGRVAGHGVIGLRTSAGGGLKGALRADGDAWPWPDGSVPSIVLQHVLEGASGGGDLLEEAARVLAPEGRLYLLRFDRFSPWFWRHGRAQICRGGGRAWTMPLDLSGLRRHGLALEYRHALGSRGLGDDPVRSPSVVRQSERWPFASAFRATRIWVLRKRQSRLITVTKLDPMRRTRPDYGLATVRRDGGDAL